MPYPFRRSRRPNYRRRFRRRTRYNPGLRALRAVRAMKKRQELKEFDHVYGDRQLFPANQAPLESDMFDLYTLNDIPQGQQGNQRIGTSVNPTSVSIRMQLRFKQFGANPDDSTQPSPVRIILFIWKPTTAAVGPNTILEPQANYENYINAFYKDSQKFNKKILFDHTYYNHDFFDPVRYIDIKRSIPKRYQFQYNNPNAEPTQNYLHLLVINGPGNATFVPPEENLIYRFISRLRYKDN